MMFMFVIGANILNIIPANNLLFEKQQNMVHLINIINISIYLLEGMELSLFTPICKYFYHHEFC